MTTSGDGEFTIHTPAEKELIPIVLHHYPICVSYALFKEGKIPVADPTALEERVSDATLVLAINAYKELCCMHLTGVSLTSPHLIQQCSVNAAERAKRVVDFIKSMLEDDEKERTDQEEKSNPKCEQNIARPPKKPRKGLIERLAESINTNFRDAQDIEKEEQDEEMAEETSDEEQEVVCGPPTLIDSKTVATVSCSDDDQEDSDDEMEMQPETVVEQPKRQEKTQAGGDSEEDETIVL